MVYGSLREKIAAESAERRQRYADYATWIDEAHQAGLAAGKTAGCTPMIVSQHENMADDNSAVVKEWLVMDGPCGFAWVTVTPGTCSFARWAVKEQGWRKDYYGGVSLYVHEFGQSMQRKIEYAHAYAKVLHSHGVGVRCNSRMD